MPKPSQLGTDDSQVKTILNKCIKKKLSYVIKEQELQNIIRSQTTDLSGFKNNSSNIERSSKQKKKTL